MPKVTYDNIVFDSELEVWADIKGYEGYYQISTLGRVKSLMREITRKNDAKQSFNTRILKRSIAKNGYYVVNLRKEGNCDVRTVHRLVMENFVPNLLNKPQVNHKDGDKLNNNINNLEWVTNKENTIHSFDLGLNSRVSEVVGIKNGTKLEFKRMKYAVDWLKENGFPKARHGNISSCCKGKRIKAYGYVWRYKNG